MTSPKAAPGADPATPRLPVTGPHGHWLLGCMRQFRRDLLGFTMQTSRQYGHYVRIRFLPGYPLYLLTHPEAVEHIMQKHHRNYRKPDVLVRPMALLMGNGLFTSEGDFWLRQRRMMQPAFHRPQLAR